MQERTNNNNNVHQMRIVTTVVDGTCVLGGFYTVPLDSGLLLIMINSNLWYYRDDKTANITDPAGQFVWLENILKDAEDHSNLVSFCTPTVSLLLDNTQLQCDRLTFYLCITRKADSDYNEKFYLLWNEAYCIIP